MMYDTYDKKGIEKASLQVFSDKTKTLIRLSSGIFLECRVPFIFFSQQAPGCFDVHGFEHPLQRVCWSMSPDHGATPRRSVTTWRHGVQWKMMKNEDLRVSEEALQMKKLETSSQLVNRLAIYDGMLKIIPHSNSFSPASVVLGSLKPFRIGK